MNIKRQVYHSLSMKPVRIALIQLKNSESVRLNRQQILENIRTATGRGANIICLQELSNTLYFCQTVEDRFFKYAENVPGPFTRTLSELASESGCVVIYPTFERQAAGLYYNTAAVIDADGSYLGKYRKMHIPDDPGFFEKYYFTPGDLGYQVFNTKYGTIGVLICWDQWYPEAARLTVLKGADILFYPTAIGTLSSEDAGTGEKYLEAWQVIQRSHAIANGCYVASVNRVGREQDIRFWGHSFVSGPFGECLGEAGDEEEILITECDFNKIEKQRQTWPFLRDRRIDSYDLLDRRYLRSEE